MNPDADGWVVAMLLDDLPEGSVAGLVLAGREIALYHLPGGEVCATDNVCTHGQALLSEGWLTEDGCIECPLHAGLFDIRTGAGQGPPIDDDLRTYPARVEDGQILVQLPTDVP